MKKVSEPIMMYAPMAGVLEDLASAIYHQLSTQTGIRYDYLCQNSQLRINLDKKGPTVKIEVIPVCRGNMREKRVADFIEMLRRGRERSEMPREPEADISAEAGD
mgnify:CR=1 FL=1